MNINELIKQKTIKKRIPGVLRRCEKNPRYFADPTGEPIYLTGSHTWSNIQEYLGPDCDKKFDYDAYLDWMEAHGFNFMRGWVWEEGSYDNNTNVKLNISPLPYVRCSSDMALDGEPKFDLDTFNEQYFERLRERIIEAGKRGIYVSVMLFNRWCTNIMGKEVLGPWTGHPFNSCNNINGIDGDPDRLGGREIHTLKYPDIVRCQENFVKKVIDTVNDLENVVYEIGNEHYEDSMLWQYHMIRLIKEYEAKKPLQHPVGITSGGGDPDTITNSQLSESDADWISPREENGMPYMKDPVAGDGSKVIIADTDHLWGIGGSVDWVWKSFTRGLNPILMDPYEPIFGLENFGIEEWSRVNNRNHPIWEPIRISMGYTRYYAERINLESAFPREDLASSGYCLADYGHEYLVYIPDGKEVIVDLGEREKDFSLEWMNPHDGSYTSGSITNSKGEVKFLNTDHSATVLYIVETDRT